METHCALEGARTRPVCVGADLKVVGVCALKEVAADYHFVQQEHLYSVALAATDFVELAHLTTTAE
jgi:hypothetical protein